AGGDLLPDACANASCGDGTCVDRNGIAVCSCNAGTAALVGTTLNPTCAPIAVETHTPGAENFSAKLATLDVCAPPPPICYGNTKYENIGTTRPGVDCGGANPPDDMQMSPGDSNSGCCQQSPQAPPIAFFSGALLVLAAILRRRGARAR